MELSRRSFLTGSAVLGAAAALGAMSGCAAPKQAGKAYADTAGSTAGTHNPVSTENCDVVIVGGGTAGICAAVRAAQLGGKVILLEKNGATGGSSYFAEGVGAVNSYLHDAEGKHFECAEVLAKTEEYHHWAADANVLDHFIRATGKPSTGCITTAASISPRRPSPRPPAIPAGT